MARKKNKHNEMTAPVQPAVNFEQEPMFESDAYFTPQPEAGSDVTVLKPVGSAGPAPIVTPSHSTVQLQAIVVPLAVVPYMSHDNSVLMTNAPAYTPAQRSMGGYPSQAAEFEAVDAKKLKKQRKAQPRVFALVNFLIYAVALLPFILALFMDEFRGISLDHYNVIEIIKGWIANGFDWQPLINIGNVAIAGICAIGAVLSLLTIVFGKYLKVLNILLTVLAIGAHVALLVKTIMDDGQFIIMENIPFLVSGIASVVNFILAIIFTVSTNKLEDKSESMQGFAREI